MDTRYYLCERPHHRMLGPKALFRALAALLLRVDEGPDGGLGLPNKIAGQS